MRRIRKQRVAAAWSAHQQVAIGRDSIHAAVASWPRAFSVDAGAPYAGYAYVACSDEAYGGMLTPEQMESLRKAKRVEFDRLFLTGMIQQHNGPLTMVKDLFDPSTRQDAELFDFATDADNSRRAEIKIMQGMLEKSR